MERTIAVLTALKFDSPAEAGQVMEKIKCLEKQQVITVQDSAIVTWPAGKNKPEAKERVSTAGFRARPGAFWSMVFGQIFFVPLFEEATSAAMGARGDKMADDGLDENFISQTREKVTEGTSALFMLTSWAVQERVLDELKDVSFDLIALELSKMQ
jgi:uncharacterized membrane protein